MDTSKYTSRKFPFMGGSVERTINDPLATVAWRQDANGPTECILVLLDGEKTFVPTAQYRQRGPRRRIDGRSVAVSLRTPIRPPGKRKEFRLTDFHSCGAW